MHGADEVKVDQEGDSSLHSCLFLTPVQSCQPLDAGQSVVLQAQLLQLSAGLKALDMADLMVAR